MQKSSIPAIIIAVLLFIYISGFVGMRIYRFGWKINNNISTVSPSSIPVIKNIPVVSGLFRADIIILYEENSFQKLFFTVYQPLIFCDKKMTDIEWILLEKAH